MKNRFWGWYRNHQRPYFQVTSILFALQLFHLYWMAAHVIALKVLGRSLFVFPPQLSWIYALVDYTEIPALVSVSIIYIQELRDSKPGSKIKSWLYLLFLNIQWVHLFWLTDEVVMASFTGKTLVFIPPWLAWTAILIDFLEIPVIIETARRAIRHKIRGSP